MELNLKWMFMKKNTDSVKIETLSIRYYFQDENGNKNYFEANHSVYDLDILYCGTSDFIKRDLQRKSGKPYYGNITKKEADSILTKWKRKKLGTTPYKLYCWF